MNTAVSYPIDTTVFHKYSESASLVYNVWGILLMFTIAWKAQTVMVLSANIESRLMNAD